jgi:hypothetical protein
MPFVADNTKRTKPCIGTCNEELGEVLGFVVYCLRAFRNYSTLD